MYRAEILDYPEGSSPRERGAQFLYGCALTLSGIIPA